MGAVGCDDAPIVEIEKGDEPKKFTMIVPYYENPRFFENQITRWSNYPVELRHHLSIIVVDDGSPNIPASDVLRNVHFGGVRLFRILKDVRWNWLAARNIGAHKANTDWIMLTDMDHVLTVDTLRTLVYGKHDPEIIYRFSRRESDGKKIHPHPNSWFMTRSMYWKVGGYDEALSGFYGTDGEYRRRCAATAYIRIMHDELERHEYEGDSSTTHYKRKQPEDAAVKKMIRARGRGWKPKTLSFEYLEVSL